MDDAVLGQFGMRPEDEGPHPVDPSVEWWNESWFWDWYDADGRSAGHCRIGLHPNQHRAWLWLFVKRDDEWIGIEAPRLPLADVDPARLAYDRWGLRFAWDVARPLARGRLTVDGFGRVLAGPRQGMMQAVGVDLDVTAIGPAHAVGFAAGARGHASQGYDAGRFEQPVSVTGTMQLGGEPAPFTGRGERDHSWGPRYWNLDWTFLAMNGPTVRVQCAEARIPDVGTFVVGYLHRERMATLAGATFDFTIRPDDVLHPIAGRFEVRAEDGDTLGGRVESVGATEIDLTHTFDPPRRSLYRRTLIRARCDGVERPVYGWIEFNRLAGS